MTRNLPAILTLTVSALLLASCAKDLGGNGSANGADSTPLSFSTSTEGTLDVKGTPATTVTLFTAAGYSGSTEWFPAAAVNTTDKYSSHKWKSGTSYTFYGYANMPSSTVATAAIASTGVTLTYTAVPTDASAQNDILLGHYSGNGGGTGTAAMKFYHPLASVVFTVGEIEGISEITSISIKGVYSTGEVEFSVSGSTPAYTWSGCSGSTTVSQTITGNLPEKNAQLGEPFILIPQTFTSPAKIKIQMSATTTAGQNQIIISELTGITLEAGKKTMLAVSYSAQHGLNFTSSLIAWNNTAEQEMDLEVGHNPDYWVDLGMVSDTGHKLYISKYNVKKENGKYFFDETGTGDSFETSEALAISTVNGESCRLLSLDEWANIVLLGVNSDENPNVSWTYNSSDRIYTVSSKILTGRSIILPVPDAFVGYHTASYYILFSDGTDPNHNWGAMLHGVEFGISRVDGSVNKVRVCYEDTSTQYTVKSDPAPYVYSFNTGQKYYDNNSATIVGNTSIRSVCEFNNNFISYHASYNDYALVEGNWAGVGIFLERNQLMFVQQSAITSKDWVVDFHNQKTYHITLTLNAGFGPPQN